jgi:SAM-dependent methyltransferase
MKISRTVAFFDRILYTSYNDNWDDDIFRDLIFEKTINSYKLLDIGAGAGIVKQMNFRNHAEFVCGIDLDRRVLENTFLDEAKVADAIEIPYEDCKFDIVISDNVIEHVEHPSKVFSEVYRVLKPGGQFLFKTPNKWHYMPIIARVTPLWFHGFINKLRGREIKDTFPTLYNANSKRSVHALALQSNFLVRRIRLIEGRPEYLRLAWPLYALGFLYERIVNSHEVFSLFRVLLIAELQKPQALDKV